MAEETKNTKVDSVLGEKKKLMFRIVSERAYKAAAVLGLQITHEWSEERSSEQEQTKDGAKASAGSMTEKISLEGLANKVTDPDVTNVDKMLHHAFREGLKVEVWEVDFEQQNTVDGENKGKYYARHGEGYLATRSSSANVEGNADLKLEINIDGKSTFGWATVDEISEAMAKEFFYDTIKDAKPVEGITLYDVQTTETPAGRSGQTGGSNTPTETNTDKGAAK